MCPASCAGKSPLFLQRQDPAHQRLDIGIGHRGFGGIGTGPHTPEPPALTFCSSLAAAVLSPRYFAATSWYAGPTISLSTAWHAAQPSFLHHRLAALEIERRSRLCGCRRGCGSGSNSGRGDRSRRAAVGTASQRCGRGRRWRAGGAGDRDFADRLDARDHLRRRFRPVSSRLTPVTSCDSNRKSTIGTRNASTSTITSCLGVFIGETVLIVIVEFLARAGSIDSVSRRGIEIVAVLRCVAAGRGAHYSARLQLREIRAERRALTGQRDGRSAAQRVKSGCVRP